MDLVTHGLLGAAAAQGLARRSELRVAAAIGFAAAMLPDADALIQSADDSLLRLEYHRQFTHALIFIPLGGLVAAGLLWPLFRQRLAWLRICLFAAAAYATAGVLDACTSYGTQLLWPFSGERVAWRIVAIIDPLIMLSLILAVFIAGIKRSRVPVAVALLFVVSYLSVGLIQKNRAEQAAHLLADQRGHTIERVEVKPTMGNLLLWRSVYQASGFYYVDALRIGMLSEQKIYPGGAVRAFDMAREFPGLERDAVLYRDMQRFATYSNGFVVRHPARPSVLGDIRYAMLPNSLMPLWGIETAGLEPDQHVLYMDIRDVNEEKIAVFLNMLTGGNRVGEIVAAGGREPSAR